MRRVGRRVPSEGSGGTVCAPVVVTDDVMRRRLVPRGPDWAPPAALGADVQQAFLSSTADGGAWGAVIVRGGDAGADLAGSDAARRIELRGGPRNGSLAEGVEAARRLYPRLAASSTGRKGECRAAIDLHFPILTPIRRIR